MIKNLHRIKGFDIKTMETISWMRKEIKILTSISFFPIFIVYEIHPRTEFTAWCKMQGRRYGVEDTFSQPFHRRTALLIIIKIKKIDLCDVRFVSPHFWKTWFGVSDFLEISDFRFSNVREFEKRNFFRDSVASFTRFDGVQHWRHYRTIHRWTLLNKHYDQLACVCKIHPMRNRYSSFLFCLRVSYFRVPVKERLTIIIFTMMISISQTLQCQINVFILFWYTQNCFG